MTIPTQLPAEAPESAGHPPVIADGEGCLEILADRLRASPGVLAIEADFQSSTLTVRYQPELVQPEQRSRRVVDAATPVACRPPCCPAADPCCSIFTPASTRS